MQTPNSVLKEKRISWPKELGEGHIISPSLRLTVDKDRNGSEKSGVKKPVNSGHGDPSY